MSVVEYAAKFDELTRLAPTIVPTDGARKTRFIHGLRPEVAKQIDNDREGPESNADAVQRALRYDGWDRPEYKNVETQTARQGEEKKRKGNNGQRGPILF